jgi:hypothetical protein
VTATELLAAIRRIAFGTRDDRDGMRQIRDFREYDEGRQ